MSKLGLMTVVGLTLLGGIGGYFVAREPGALPSRALEELVAKPQPQPQPTPSTATLSYNERPYDSAPPDGAPDWDGESFRIDTTNTQLKRLEGRRYDQARVTLRALGYRPLIFQCWMHDGECVSPRTKFREELDCAGSMGAPCIFGWVNVRKGRYLMVNTVGEWRPKVAVVEIASWNEVEEGHGRLLSPPSHRASPGYLSQWMCDRSRTPTCHAAIPPSVGDAT